MPRNWLISFFAAVVLSSANLSASDLLDFDQGVDIREAIAAIQEDAAAPRPLPATGQGTRERAEWTVMVYVNAKNNLEAYGLQDVNEMEMIGSSDKVKVAVELGRLGYTGLDSWRGQRRYIIERDQNMDVDRIISRVREHIPQADMGDWRHLVEFVNWAKTEAPAQRYMLIIWNHGSGWNKKTAEFQARGISYDDETGHHITTEELGKALAAMGKVHVYGSDACLMQMAEVSYQIKDHADFIVGSEETEPGDGYAYNTLLAPMVAQPSMSAQDAARLIVKSFTDNYIYSDEGSTHSAVRGAALGALVPLLDAWTEAVMAANEKELVRSVLDKTQYFTYRENKDLLHFIKLVNAGTKDPAVKTKGAPLENFLLSQVIAANGVNGTYYNNAFGLAIYLPSAGYNQVYDNLDWAKDSKWPEFVRWVTGTKKEAELAGL